MQQEPQNSKFDWWKTYQEITNSPEYQALPVTPYVHTPRPPAPEMHGRKIEFKQDGLPLGWKAYRSIGEQDWTFYRPEDMQISGNDKQFYHDRRQSRRQAEDNLLALNTLQAQGANVAWRQRENNDRPKGAAFHSYEDVLNAPPVEFVIEDFLQKDAITLLGGPPAAMKTYSALSIAKSLLSEEPLFDYFQVNARAKRVLYLSPESALGPFSDRVKKLNMMPFVQDGSFLFSTISATDPIRDLRDGRLIEQIPGADVFLDTIVRFAEGDENSAEAQRVFSDNLFWLLKQGARTVTGLHHAPKAFSGASNMNLDNVLRGSGDIGAAAATVWGFSKIDVDKSQIYVKCVKDRDFRQTPQPFVIEGRPHLDETGKFKMLQVPGDAPDYASIKQSERGRKGGRPKSYFNDEQMAEAVKLLDAGSSQEAVAGKFSTNKRSLMRAVDTYRAGRGAKLTGQVEGI